MKTVSIVCAKSWGRLGNYNSALLAAKHIANLHPHLKTQVIPLEELWPEFEEWGQRMQSASAQHCPKAVQSDFNRIYDDIGQVIHSKEGISDKILDVLVDKIIEHSQIVVGMKGLASRVLCTARKRAINKPIIVNWVTNPGLLDLEIHRCDEINYHVVPFDWDAKKISDNWNVPQEIIFPVGPPISLAYASKIGTSHAPTSGCSPQAVMYFHYLNENAGKVVRSILHSNKDFHVTALFAASSKDVEKQLLEFAADFDGRFTLSKAKKQSEFIELLNNLSSASKKVLIAKSGPNTMFEAVGLGIPILFFESGLPQEKWVGQFIREKNIGICVTEIDGICDAFDNATTFQNQKTFLQNQEEIWKEINATVGRKRSALETIFN